MKSHVGALYFSYNVSTWFLYRFPGINLGFELLKHVKFNVHI